MVAEIEQENMTLLALFYHTPFVSGYFSLRQPKHQYLTILIT